MNPCCARIAPPGQEGCRAPIKDAAKPPQPCEAGWWSKFDENLLNHHPVCGLADASRFFLLPQPPLLARRGNSRVLSMFSSLEVKVFYPTGWR